MNDVLVIGGGTAGLSGALTLARARRAVLVIDSGSPRNAPAGGVHNYLGRENTPPAELLRIGREEVRSYGGRILDGTAVSAERAGGGFTVTLADGSAVRGRRLLVATGVSDELPEMPELLGLAERWGRDVLHCPYCHGTEVAERPVGVLSTGPLAEHTVLQWRQWTSRLVLLTHTGPAPKDPGLLAARGIGVVDGEVSGLDVAGDRLTGVTLAGGRKVPLEALVVAPRPVVHSGLLSGLGLEPVPLEMAGHVVGERVAADPTGATRVPGVWVAGNVSDPMAQVIVSAAAGMRAGAAINADLIAEGP
ncbi:NAD(P)/FAD-dependent oxidoreductase [Nonomuraea longicatena]|uniref:NAD(P)/FAD-dependent oxidoreductase n=1 Tax=Nonomuraea longicatena TaxID=83682 RepID=A0ABN1QL69_9ACTN